MVNDALEQDYIDPVIDDSSILYQPESEANLNVYKGVDIISNDTINFYDPAFTGFSLVSGVCILCIGIRGIINLFSRNV